VSALAQFLRTRRSALRPTEVGLPAGGRRRVAGLRREEVALLAGISTDYYLRLEQGREVNPSDQVLKSIGRALRLDDDAVAYLRNLVHHQSFDRSAEQAQKLHPALGGLLEGWPLTAAHVVDPGLTTVISNELAAALSPSFATGSNSMRSVFLDHQMRSFYREWIRLTAWAVPLVRAIYGRHPDRALVELVDELRERSPRFRQLWARHDVKETPAGMMLVDHPLVGPLDLHFQQMALPRTGHILVTYWAEPDSPSEAGLLHLRDC
jgi:transcriptional regulator with XRE-family HTH domain